MYKNPFLETFAATYLRIVKAHVPSTTTEIEPGDFYTVETGRSTRIYRDDVCMKVLYDMPSPGLKLFLWITAHIGDNSHTVKLNEADLVTTFDCSAKTISRAKTELLKQAIIAKKEANVYWINPRFIAAGARHKVYPEQAICVGTRKEGHS